MVYKMNDEGDWIDDDLDVDGNPTARKALVDTVDVSTLVGLPRPERDIRRGDLITAFVDSSINRLPIGNKNDILTVAESGVARIPAWKRQSIVRIMIFGG